MTLTDDVKNPVGVKRHRVSNSEASCWNTCQRQYYYSYDLNLEPVTPTEAINRGHIGHAVLEEYYKERASGVPHGAALLSARGLLQRKLAEGGDLAVITDVDRIVQGYFEFYGDEINVDYKILAVEKEYDIPITDTATYVMKLDLLVQTPSGEIQLWDHKFIYDFWSFDKVNLSGQFPKYVGALRFLGIPVGRSKLNQLRYRKLKNSVGTDLYKRTEQTPSEFKIKRSLKEQIMATQEIIAWRARTIEDRGESAKRILNPQVCNGCFFKGPCQAEFDGNDLRFVLEGEFKRKTSYGYNNDNTEDLL